MVKANYSPIGVEADFNNAFYTPYPAMPANTYSYNIRFLPYYCEGNMLKTAHETSTTLMIGINMFDSEIYETFGENDSEGKGFHSMDDMPVQKDGNYFFKEKNTNLGFGVTGKSTMWLITHDGELPYAYVSKKNLPGKTEAIISPRPAGCTCKYPGEFEIGRAAKNTVGDRV